MLFPVRDTLFRVVGRMDLSSPMALLTDPVPAGPSYKSQIEPDYVPWSVSTDSLLVDLTIVVNGLLYFGLSFHFKLRPA